MILYIPANLALFFMTRTALSFRDICVFFVSTKKQEVDVIFQKSTEISDSFFSMNRMKAIEEYEKSHVTQ